ncbi:MAG TPA: [acyl-carrier-protein] S-malonyltransferase, partial [Cryomorphaceae bacterium]|nr:[acyl-carrier-protein] S-malonyltransferase [Cryomorphaceae bacterium]
MGKDLYENNTKAKALFDKGNEVLGFSLSTIMFEGTGEELKETKVTQPAIFILSVIMARLLGKGFQPTMVAGHSLGEFSALTAVGALDFESALKLVSARAMAMQKACEKKPSTMAAILGLSDEQVENICVSTPG